MPPTTSAWNKPFGHNQKKENESAKLNGEHVAGKSPGSVGEGTKSANTAMNYKEVQQDEVDVLQAIYFDGFEEVGNNNAAWNKPADHAFRIRLRSRVNEDVAIYLSVQLTATYPNTTPILSATDMEFLRSDFRGEISKVLVEKPPTLLGHEMIHEIAESIEEILDRAAQNIAINVDAPTLEEERALQEKANLEAAQKEEEEAKQLQEEAKRDEERMMGRMLSAELSRRRERARQVKKTKQPPGLDETPLGIDDTEQSVSFDRAVSIKDKKGNAFHFHTVGGMVKLRQGPATEVLLVHPKTSQDFEIPPPALALKKIRLKAIDNHGTYKRSIQDLEQELEKLKSLSGRNANVIDILDFKVTAEIGDYSWNVTILTEFANRGSLKELLEISGGGCPAIQNIRMRAVQLLDALEFYHCNGLVHGALHAANILFTESTSGPPTLKIADTGFQWRLRHLSDQSNILASLGMETQSPGWFPPDLFVEEQFRPTRKLDIWSFGIIFLQMIFGLEVTQKHSSPTELPETLSLSESLNEYIRKIFKSDPKKRPSAFNLLTEEFIRDSVPIMATHSPLHSRISSTSLLSPQMSRTRQDSVTTPMLMSRYLNDFDEVGRLGKGGFGEVVKSRNKLDGQLYAIKKITQNTTGSLSEVLSEIMLLSRLNHPHVVRYFTAWIEEDSNWPSETDEEVFSTTEESSSLAPNATGPSVEFGHTSGLDIISSSGYPNIEFGYDTEEDTGSESDGVSPNDDRPAGGSDGDASGGYFGLKRTRSGSKAARPTRKTLYIQMEYCEKHTLRDLIRRDISKNPDEIWTMLRQIVEGLQHIHGHGIIHRDLKPDNVFIDVTNTPRIGDFGLATSGQYTIADKVSSQGTNLASDLTRSIGTALYVAPELRSTANESYTDKVDMYSLGVILFEMCHKLPTFMERDMILRRLREKEHSLPLELSKGAKAPLGEIILSLINHDPKERPSSSELLQSGKLPLQVGDETIRQALQGLSDSKSPYYQKMMTALFTQPIRQVKDYAWDMDVSTKIGANELLLQSLVKEELCAIFRHHGAVETTRPLLFPRSTYYPSNAVQLLDQSGTLVQLPYDLTLPNARAIAKRSPAALKSFTFGSIFRNLHDGAQPSSHPEVDFDIITHDTKDLALKEAEVIKVIDEVVDAFPSLASAQMCFHINHSELLEIIMEFCRIGVSQRAAVKDIVSKLHIQDWTWQKIRNSLRAPSLGVSSTSLDEMSRFDFRDEPAKAFQRIKEIFDEGGFSDEVYGRVQGIIMHMNDVFVYLKRLNVLHKFYVSPLSSFNDKFYKGGLLFQCLYDNKKRDVFAAGGRYDRLIRDHRPKTQGSYDECHAVGFNLAWEKIFKSMLRHQKTTGKAFLKKNEEATQGPWAERRCDVLVASFDSSTLRSTGLNIVRELWAAGISAEIAVDARSPDELTAYYKDDRHNWIVMIKQETGGYGERLLKVRNMVRKEDNEVRSSELRAWLQGEIRDRNQREGTQQRAHLFRAASLPETSQSWSEHDPDVRVLFSQHKGKKNNRRSVVEAAHTRTQSLATSLLDGPVAAIEIRDEVLDEMRSTRLSDPDSWRKLIQSVPVNDRKYLGQVHDLLRDLANEMKAKTRNAFVYNLRTGACIYYDLGA